MDGERYRKYWSIRVPTLARARPTVVLCSPPSSSLHYTTRNTKFNWNISKKKKEGVKLQTTKCNWWFVERINERSLARNKLNVTSFWYLGVGCGGHRQHHQETKDEAAMMAVQRWHDRGGSVRHLMASIPPVFFFFVISLFHSLTQTAKHTNSLDEKKRQIYFCCLFVCVCRSQKRGHTRGRAHSLSPLSDAHKLLAIEQNFTDWRENPRAEEKGRERDRGWDRSITNNRGTTHAPASWSLSTLCRPCRR